MMIWPFHLSAWATQSCPGVARGLGMMTTTTTYSTTTTTTITERTNYDNNNDDDDDENENRMAGTGSTCQKTAKSIPTVGRWSMAKQLANQASGKQVGKVVGR